MAWNTPFYTEHLLTMPDKIQWPGTLLFTQNTPFYTEHLLTMPDEIPWPGTLFFTQNTS